MNYGTKQSALYKCVGRLMRPVLIKKCVKMPQCESTISARECTEILDDLRTLKMDLDSMPAKNISGKHRRVLIVYEHLSQAKTIYLFRRCLRLRIAYALSRYINALSSFIGTSSNC